MKLIKKTEDVIREEYRIIYGDICQICGKHTKQAGLFHILDKRRYPKIRLHKINLLWVGWYCCHYPFHHDPYEARDRIIPKIQEIRGVDFEDQLKALDKMQGRQDMTYLELRYIQAQEELDNLKNQTIIGARTIRRKYAR
jgi:hypothetical protein